ncbi:protein O-mannosyl-transferase TMTC1-like [Thomomys bottae]
MRSLVTPATRRAPNSALAEGRALGGGRLRSHGFSCAHDASESGSDKQDAGGSRLSGYLGKLSYPPKSRKGGCGWRGGAQAAVSRGSRHPPSPAGPPSVHRWTVSLRAWPWHSSGTRQRPYLRLPNVSKRLEHKEVLVGLLFLAFPFLPASNLFFRVWFVVAERVLYMPSMGYCILFVHGLSKLYTWLNRCGATLSVSTVLLLLLFSWKTVKQNEIWLSRESLFRSGVETLPHNAKVHYNYANFLKDQGRNQEAVYHYRTALKPSVLLDYFVVVVLQEVGNRLPMARVSISQGQKEDAIALLKDSIKYGPEFADAYSSLASLLAEQARFKEAEEVYQAGIKHCPDSSDLHNNYGVFLVDFGSPEKAAAHYREAVRLSPGHHVAMVNLGRLYRSQGENSLAEECYKRALQVACTAEVLSPLGALYYNTGQLEDALHIYREAAALQPSQRELRLALAQVLAVLEQAEEAEQIVSLMVVEEAECLERYRLLSAIYSKQEHHDKALSAIDHALQLKPKDPKVLSELFFTKGNQLREQNLLDKAYESYQAAVELNPDQAQAWMNMGGIQHMQGNYVPARTYYERALQLLPDNKLLKENLHKLHRLEKRLQEVRRKDHT